MIDVVVADKFWGGGTDKCYQIMVTVAGVIPQTVIDKCESAFSEVDQDHCGMIDIVDLTKAFKVRSSFM
eukprot:749841-Hanusia_phi.AAC.7